MTAPSSVWTDLAKPFPKTAIEWRMDGRMFLRDGKPFGRFVAFIGAHAVRARLDEIVAGDWTLALELLPPTPDADGVLTTVFKARLTINGIFREDVGVGRDAKAASSDSMKRVSARFGIGAELHRMFAIVPLESDAKYAKPLESPQVVYDRRNRSPATTTAPPATAAAPPARPSRPTTPPMRDPRVAQGAPAPSRSAPPEPPPLNDADGPSYG
jgi:hypothetical protein